MPGRNINKTYLEESYYHIYSRGVNKEAIFRQEEDYSVFLNLFKRYLNEEPTKDNKGREYPWYHRDIELLAFCLMPNHVHLLVFQHSLTGMTQLLKSIMTTYSMYFNEKYKRVGPVFQSRFRASLINKDNYLQHISRYIHLNPLIYQEWQFSSLPYYLGEKDAKWIKPDKILELFNNNHQEYANFLADYQGHKKILDELKKELAAS